jgi:hypothetical protein
MKFLVMVASLLFIISPFIQPCLAGDQTPSLRVNNQLCHMIEDSPSCSGIAPQKSQNADIPIRTSLSMKELENSLKSSKTEIDHQRISR